MVERFGPDRRTIFDPVAEQYDEVRPGYPEALLDELIALSGIPEGGRILEIGCGPGKATLPFARRGYAMLCIDIGENMIRVARRRLEAFPRVEFWRGPFEEWPVRRESFDLVISAQAMHWIDEKVRFQRPRDALKPDGSLALIWNYFVSNDEGFSEATRPIYERYAPEITGRWGRSLEDRTSRQTADIDRSGLYGPVVIRRHPWSTNFRRDEYVRLIDTYSDHRVIEPEKRSRLYEAIGEVIDSMGGSIRQDYQAVVVLAPRLA